MLHVQVTSLTKLFFSNNLIICIFKNQNYFYDLLQSRLFFSQFHFPLFIQRLVSKKNQLPNVNNTHYLIKLDLLTTSTKHELSERKKSSLIIVIYTNLYVKQTLFHCQPALKPALSFFNVSLSKPIIEYNQLGDINLLVSIKI
jgi:hypothetical protein